MRVQFPKTIVYVKSYKDCITICQLLKANGSRATNPVKYPNLSAYRLIEMYTRVELGGI